MWNYFKIWHLSTESLTKDIKSVIIAKKMKNEKQQNIELLIRVFVLSDISWKEKNQSTLDLVLHPNEETFDFNLGARNEACNFREEWLWISKINSFHLKFCPS